MKTAIRILVVAWFATLGYILCTGFEPCERGHGLYTGRAC